MIYGGENNKQTPDRAEGGKKDEGGGKSGILDVYI